MQSINMFSKRATILILSLFFVIFSIACSASIQTNTNIQQNKDIIADKVTSTTGELKVHFINVGQADSILVQQGTNFMLIDAGNNEDANTVKGYLESQGVKELQYFIGTHSDEDHIGSADNVVKSFKINKIYFPKQTASTKTFSDFVNAVKNKKLLLSPNNF